MLIVVSYDIPNDKRRDCLRKLLKGYGDPVQRSVFECLLDEQGLNDLRKKVDSVIRVPDDSVIYYPLCRMCKGRKKETRNLRRPSQQTTIVV